MKTASAPRVDEGAREGDDDGILFGDSCERRVFFPGSGKHNTAVAGDVHGSQQRAPATDPLCALGLFPSSPYGLLRQNAPAPDNAAQPECINKKARRSKSPKHEARAIDVGRGAYAPLEQLWTTAAATAYRGKRCSSPAPMESYEEIYSPQKLQRCRGRLKPVADGNQESPAYSAAGESFDDESAMFLLQKIRAGERATVEEAARLRCEADASVMIRRFWRRSG